MLQKVSRNDAIITIVNTGRGAQSATGNAVIKSISTPRLSNLALSLAVVILFGVLDNLGRFDAMDFLLGIAGYVYDEDYLEEGVYYHHSGSSCSNPKGTNSWIKAIKRACGLGHDESLDCCVSDCDEDADVGAHLTESRIREFLSLIGMGGTPVVPMCYGCHGTGPVEIDGTPCIYDKGTPIDMLWGKPTLSNVRCNNENCENYTVGPDSEDNYWCPDCQHFVDSDGDCVTDGCTSEGCYEDDDDDDDGGWW
jgi:hypothetical protein